MATPISNTLQPMLQGINEAEQYRLAANAQAEQSGLSGLNNAMQQYQQGNVTSAGLRQPYIDAGARAVPQAEAYAGAIDPAKMQSMLSSDVILQNALQTGSDVMNKRAAAGGGRFSGAHMQDLQAFGQNEVMKRVNELFGQQMDLAKLGLSPAQSQAAQEYGLGATLGDIESQKGTLSGESALSAGDIRGLAALDRGKVGTEGVSGDLLQSETEKAIQEANSNPASFYTGQGSQITSGGGTSPSVFGPGSGLPDGTSTYSGQSALDKLHQQMQQPTSPGTLSGGSTNIGLGQNQITTPDGRTLQYDPTTGQFVDISKTTSSITSTGGIGGLSVPGNQIGTAVAQQSPSGFQQGAEEAILNQYGITPDMLKAAGQTAKSFQAYLDKGLDPAWVVKTLFGKDISGNVGAGSSEDPYASNPLFDPRAVF